jgi:hypothetical protein
VQVGQSIGIPEFLRLDNHRGEFCLDVAGPDCRFLLIIRA